MVDYEISCYIVWYVQTGVGYYVSEHFKTEEAAVEFVKANSCNWVVYRLEKHSRAVIDF